MLQLVCRILSSDGVIMPQEQEMVKREIDATDKAIDKLVYELSRKGIIYGLTEEEIGVVEGARWQSS